MKHKNIIPEEFIDPVINLRKQNENLKNEIILLNNQLANANKEINRLNKK